MRRIVERWGVIAVALLGSPLCVYSQAVPPVSNSGIRLLDAVESVLAHHPLIRYQEAQIDVSRGLKQQASSIFNTNIQADLSQARTSLPLTRAQQQQYALINVSGTAQATDLTSANTGISRLYRSGISVGPSISISRDVDNISNAQGVNTADFNLVVALPLLRGRGRDVVASGEIAAQMEVEASVLDLTQEISQLLSTTANEYWGLVAAQELLGISREAEQRAEIDLENTRTLVEADHLPRENLNAVSANVAQSSAALIAAEQNLAAAQYQLASDMGVDAQQIVALSPAAIEDFPKSAVLDPLSLTTSKLQSYVQSALLNRSDYLAAQKRVEEQAVRVRAARNQLLPQLNLNLAGGYSGLAEGTSPSNVFTSTVQNVRGANVSAYLTYNFSPRNDLARGALLQASAVETQLDQQSKQTARAISTLVASTVQAVYHSALQVRKADEAVALYRTSLNGQREKYHLGIASVIDVLTVENLLTNALTTQVQADLAYATALVQLRFASGAFITPGVPVQTLTADLFRTPPQLDPSPLQP